MVLIRPATPGDAGDLAALRYEFRAGRKSAVEPRDSFVSRCAKWMAGRLSHEAAGWRCWIARDEPSPVGHVWLLAIDKIPNPVAERETHGYVTNLYVRPAFRGQGTGGRLLREALAWCRSNGVDAVILWPTPESRSLYARHGFVSETGLMELRGSA